MNAMFASSVFHHDLCAWSEKMGNIVSGEAVHRMFSYSCCSVMDSPNLGRSAKSPLCQVCPEVFSTRQELLDAVDEYLEDRKYNRSPAPHLGLYTNPIGQWKVGRIADFSEVFSWYRNSDVEYFNENIQDWDMSNAEYMYAMFEGKKSALL